MDRRIGRFSISRQLVDHDAETVRAVMGRCIIVRCEMMYESNSLQYVAVSPEFAEVPLGQIIPGYDVIISDNGARIEFKPTQPL